MPRGSQHDETGLPLTKHGQLVLCRDDGGMWRLDASRKAGRLSRRHVRVIGTRADFDLLDVTSIVRA